MMKLSSKLISFGGIFVLLWSVSGCSEELQQVTSKDDVIVNNSASELTLRVYKSPTCGCCGDWITHVEAAGFNTRTFHPTDLNQIKSDNNIAPIYQSCHTAISDQGYVFEGHIPAKYVQQFLQNPPADAIGLSVPAMPVGSPGMEVADKFSPYKVLLLKKNGDSEVFAHVTVQEEQYQ